MVVNNFSGLHQAVLHIQGMSCEGCEGHVNNALLQKRGVQQVSTSYAKGISIVKFDSGQTSPQQLIARVEMRTGYKVTQNDFCEKEK